MLTLYRKIKTLSLMTGLWLLTIALLAPTPVKVDTHSVIVQSDDLARIKSAVTRVGGKITRDLDIINSLDTDYGPEIGCSNRSDIDADLAGLAHYAGLAPRNEEGDYYIKGYEGNLWNDSFLCKGGFLWKDNFLRNDTLIKPVLISA